MNSQATLTRLAVSALYVSIVLVTAHPFNIQPQSLEDGGKMIKRDAELNHFNQFRNQHFPQQRAFRTLISLLSGFTGLDNIEHIVRTLGSQRRRPAINYDRLRMLMEAAG